MFFSIQIDSLKNIRGIKSTSKTKNTHKKSTKTGKTSKIKQFLRLIKIKWNPTYNKRKHAVKSFSQSSKSYKTFLSRIKITCYKTTKVPKTKLTNAKLFEKSNKITCDQNRSIQQLAFSIKKTIKPCGLKYE